jgi:nicotinamidase/pyrazinamidase
MRGNEARVLEYFRRMEKGEIPAHDPEEKGVWSVVGGSREIGGRYKIDMRLKGRFIDALAEAVGKDAFYGEWVTKKDAGRSDSGYVMKYEPVRVPVDHDLDGIELNLLLRDEKKRGGTIAWNVDTQYDFVSPVGKLPVPEALEIEGNLGLLTGYFRDKGIKIVSTGDWHTPDSAELSDNPDYKTTFPPHCLIGTPGAEYIPAVAPIDPVIVDWRAAEIDLGSVKNSGEIVLYKDKFDIFSGNPHADAALEALAPKNVVVYGLATNVCVDYAVRGLLERKKEVYVVEDAIKGLPGIPSPIDDWKDLGAKMIRTYDLVRDG